MDDGGVCVADRREDAGAASCKTEGGGEAHDRRFNGVNKSRNRQLRDMGV
jgi:hypothetical protein